MMRSGVAILALAIASCASQSTPAACEWADFAPAPYDHIVENVPAIRTSAFAGRLRVNPMHITGGWPAGLDAKFELHGPNGFREFVETTDDGTFAREGLPAGAYCYKLSASGFRSMTGTVTIDRGAGATPLEIELLISE